MLSILVNYSFSIQFLIHWKIVTNAFSISMCSVLDKHTHIFLRGTLKMSNLSDAYRNIIFNNESRVIFLKEHRLLLISYYQI